jgi:hypothetical protein
MKFNFRFFKSLLFIALIVTVVSSCKKDDPDPDYVGTWVVTGTMSDGDVTLELKEVLKISKGSFEQIQQLKNPTTNVWLNLMGLKGTFTLDKNKMNITLTAVGQSSFSTITNLPTGQIEYIESTDPDFDEFLTYLEIPETYVSEYMVSGKEITIKTDMNGDSDYNDQGEVTTYTRQ